MKSSPLLLITGCCAAGLLAGYAGHRLMPRPVPPSPAVTTASPTALGRSGGSGTETNLTGAFKVDASRTVSTDTLESLIALEGEPSYSRLALWLVDATEPEIAAYWQFYRQRKDRSNNVNDLIFIHWTRVDPQAAITASAGTPDEHYAWWAWACHDPKQALATAMASRPERVNNVTWGIGEFQADWLMAHFRELPEQSRGNAINGLVKWDDSPDPRRVLDFLKEHGHGFNQRLFKSLARKDPWAAYEWLQANGKELGRYGGPEYANTALIDTMRDSSPEMLERFAKQLPSGELKRKAEAALFKQLAVSDPDMAWTQATGTKSSAVAVERFATLGLERVKTDPEQALEAARRMFATVANPLRDDVTIDRPNGRSTNGNDSSMAGELVDRLLGVNPAALIEMAKGSSNPGDSSDPFASDPFQTIAWKWAARDLDAYAEWVNTRAEPGVRDQAVGVMISNLTENQHYEAAAAWALSMSDPNKSGLFSVMHTWSASDPDAVNQWLESADLPVDRKNSIRQMLPHR